MVLVVVIAKEQDGMDIIPAEKKRLIRRDGRGDASQAGIGDQNHRQTQRPVQIRLGVTIGARGVDAAGGFDESKVDIALGPGRQGFVDIGEDILVFGDLRCVNQS